MAKRSRVDIGFGRRLRAVREAAGLTQKALADRAGTWYQTIHKYEASESEPVWSVVVRLADALGVPTDSFREPPPVPPDLLPRPGDVAER